MLRNELEEVEDKFEQVSLRKRSRHVSFVSTSRRHCAPKLSAGAARSPGTLLPHKAVSFSLTDRGALDMRKKRFDDEADEVEGLLECLPTARFGTLELTPLMIAARAGDLGTVEALLERGANPMDSDCRGFDALMYAVRDGHAIVAHLLLKAIKRAVSRSGETGYSFLNAHGLTHMLYAATNGHTDCVDILRRNGSRVDLPDASGFTPLMAACQNGHYATAELLLNFGAKVDRPDRQGMTALAWAVREGSTACIELLIRFGADIQQSDKKGRSPLFWAVFQGHTEIGEYLLQAGAQVTDLVRYTVLRSHVSQIKRQSKQESRGRACHPGAMKTAQSQQDDEKDLDPEASPEMESESPNTLHNQGHHPQSYPTAAYLGHHQHQSMSVNASTGGAPMSQDTMPAPNDFDDSLNSFDTVFEADEDSDDIQGDDAASDDFASDQSPDQMHMTRLELPRDQLELQDDELDDDVFDLDEDMQMPNQAPPSSSMPTTLPSIIPTL
mmetsp:Transcript_14126/g.27427  ORF Transcript_14126/g.27427 Transcript_14126/m.27427 type:complete len:498 (-) Transcript_14126:123-1616(-)|eukprot:CAMPEP_0171502276 /NCGR_PEP_ID=MMETSP0958-20121227/10076_1 /TAXON_ID=87120 /ORGANISM="Aurantiochytrium limacinum, Strain ATCCMYA-1381" /LENGTH=497 /DNA_ID=CAMNT_0012037289 /DNA_START=1068 /DNA_END=2561 /DNA_ORIENTATION=-